MSALHPQIAIESSKGEVVLTSINILMDKLRHGALGRLSSRLTLELGTDVSRAALVECPLERVILPPKEIVSVLGVAGSVPTTGGCYSARLPMAELHVGRA